MGIQEPIIFYIVLRQSLHLNGEQIAYCAADAVQFILMRYFTLQVVAVKTHHVPTIHDEHLKETTEWLGSSAKKSIIIVNDDVWQKLKNNHRMGKDVFCLKNKELTETTLMFWPTSKSHIISCIENTINC